MVAFINTFLSYLMVFVIIVALVVISLVLGVKIRHAKDAKSGVASAELTTEDGAKQEV